MKKLLAFLVLTIVVMATNLSANAKTFETHDLNGSIGKYKIVMNLTFDSQDHSITGWYYYKSKGPKNKININGIFKGDGKRGKLKLKEVVNGEITGNFSGDYDLENRNILLTGTWEAPNGNTLEWYAEND